MLNKLKRATIVCRENTSMKRHQNSGYVPESVGTPGFVPNDTTKKSPPPKEFSMTDALLIHGWTCATIDAALRTKSIELFYKAGRVYVRIL